MIVHSKRKSSFFTEEINNSKRYYLPHKVFKSSELEKVNVYIWKMYLYQLLSRTNYDDLKKKIL